MDSQVSPQGAQLEQLEQGADAGAVAGVGDAALALELAALECAAVGRQLFDAGNVAGMIAAETCAARIRQLGGPA